MNDVVAMPIGMTRTEITTFPQVGSLGQEDPQAGIFASLLEQYASEESPEHGSSLRQDAGMPDNPLLRLLTLLKKTEDEKDEKDLPPAELAALANLFIAYRPAEQIPVAPDDANDMEVNNALAFADPEVQDERTDLLSRITGEKESGVFLRILGKLFEEHKDILPIPPLFDAASGGDRAQKAPDGLLNMLDLVIERLDALKGDSVSFVSLPESLEFESFSLMREPLVPLLPLLRDLRASAAALDESAELPADTLPPDLLDAGIAESDGPGAEQPVPEVLPEKASAQPGKVQNIPAEPVKPAAFDAKPAELANPPAVYPSPAQADGAQPRFEPVIQRVNVHSVIEQLAQSAALNRSEGVTRLELQLNPEFLGKVSVVLTSGQDGLSATLKSASEATRNLLAENITALQNTLRDMGVNMKSIDVTNPGLSWDFSRNQNPEQRGYPESGRRGFGSRRAERPEAISAGPGVERAAVLSGTVYNSSGVYAPETSIDYKA